MSRETRSVDLNCGHVAYYYPRPFIGDIVYCQRCVDFRAVTGGNVNHLQHRVKCEDCKYNILHNCDASTAIIRAETHSIKNDHVVIVSTALGELVSVIKP